MSHKIPQIIDAIAIDQKLLVRLFSNSSPFLLPVWFRKENHCQLKRKSTSPTSIFKLS